jgi:hypothetical protein
VSINSLFELVRLLTIGSPSELTSIRNVEEAVRVPGLVEIRPHPLWHAVAPCMHAATQEGSVPARSEAPAYQTYVESWDAEKRIASELGKLRRQVKKLHKDIRGGALPMRNKDGGPSLPTHPERRLRSMSNDAPKRKPE